MRFFRRNDAPRRAPHDTIEAPRVEGDVVYDEHGEVLFDPTIAMGTPNHVAPIPEQVCRRRLSRGRISRRRMDR